jgi:hypothetical protein
MSSTFYDERVDGTRAVVSGRFQEQLEAERAVSAFKHAGFADSQIASFYVASAGQHDIYPLGGDEAQSPGTEHAVRGSVAAAGVGTVAGAVTGLATVPILGPAALAAGVGVGAWVGALYGALSGTEEKAAHGNGARPTQDAARKSGMLVAVAVHSVAREQQAIDIMRAEAAHEIARGRGRIEHGEWKNFDPLQLLDRV